jgi:Fe-S-cluster-containing dehydrogenase component
MIATIFICVGLAAVVAAIVVKLARDKRQGKCLGCDGCCEACPLEPREPPH